MWRFFVTGLLSLEVLLAIAASSSGQTVSDYAVMVSAVVQTNPPMITLAWPSDPAATGYQVYRKYLNDLSWGTPGTLAANASSYTDTNVVMGGAYEYALVKTAPTYNGFGFIYSGIQAPLIESRGKVVLLVDISFSSSLSNELARLEQDLVGDGWTVLRHDIPRMSVDPANTNSSVWAARSNDLANAKALVLADYRADPTNVKAVFLFGHVPVPYSGNFIIPPDGHGDHEGAWPADLYYGDMNGVWTDSGPANTYSSDLRNWNFPGDGKFDQSSMPTNVNLEIGRVDFANLPSFPQSELELLRRYLRKDHNFREMLVTPKRRGLIDDNFGLLSGEAPAQNGWRNFAPFFGATNTFTTSDWFGTLSTNSYLWAYGCGPGTYTSCSGVGSTSDFVANDPQVVFTMLFGSYFGDWDSQDNLLRAAIATPTYTLTSSWGARPNWFYHHMGLGENIGFGAFTTQNYAQDYVTECCWGEIHVALMGDPTLRMEMVAPPANLQVVSNVAGGLKVSWQASADTNVLGYYLYSAPTGAGPFTRLTANLLTNLCYTNPVANTNVYMLRAVKLEVTGSGSYTNASQGIFQSLDPNAVAPGIVVYQPTNNATFGLEPNIQICADTLDPANNITNVAFYANNVMIGQSGSYPYSMSWSNVSGGVYALRAQAQCANGQVANSALVTVGVDNGGSPRLSITPQGGGTNVISGTDIMGRTFRIQCLDNLLSNDWQTLGTATANSSWIFQFLDSMTSTQRLYRSIFP